MRTNISENANYNLRQFTSAHEKKALCRTILRWKSRKKISSQVKSFHENIYTTHPYGDKI